MPPRIRNLQRIARTLHLWIGLAAGAFLSVMGLTGTIIAFRPTIESALAPKVQHDSRPVSLAAIEQRFVTAHPGARITRITIPQEPAGLVLIQAEGRDRNRLEIYIETASGRELGPRRTLNWLDWAVDLHQNLLMGKQGRAVTGAIGIALLLIALSGLTAWFVGAREWRRGFAMPRKGPWRRANYELHRWAGLWANVFLLAVSLTGIVLAYPESFQRAVRLITGAPQPARQEAAAGPRSPKRTRPLDDYIRTAVAVIPGGVVRELRMPSRRRPAVAVYLWAPGDIRPKGENTVFLDPASGSVLSVDRSGDAPLSGRLLELANAVHKAELGGLPLKFAWSLLGLLLPLLCASGVLTWWNRKQNRLKIRPAPIFSECQTSADSSRSTHSAATAGPISADADA